MYFINGVLEFERFHQQQQDFVCKFHLLVDRPAKEAPKVGPASRCFCVGLKQFESFSLFYIQDTDFDIVDTYIYVFIEHFLLFQEMLLIMMMMMMMKMNAAS